MTRHFTRIVSRSATKVLLLAAVFAADTAHADKPKAILLAIGIEKYELEHLNALSYVAEDTLGVARAISNIADLDAARSRIMISDREWKSAEPIPGEIAGIPVESFDDGIKRSSVTDAVEEFFAKVNRQSPSPDAPEEIVFVYLGGHGESQSDEVGVSFLPSDFRDDFTRDYSISTLTTEHDNGPKLNNTVIILNMCKSGNLPGSMAASSKRELRDQIIQLSKGSAQRHFVPASVSYQNTFEWDGKGSLLALALTDVLKYATEPGSSQITLGSLWRALGDRLDAVQQEFETAEGIELDLTPVNLADQLTETAAALPIGKTNEFAARQSQLMAEALAAVAFDRQDQDRTEILRLASHLFGRAADLSVQDLAENRLWQGRTMLAAGEKGSDLAFDAARRAAHTSPELQKLTEIEAQANPVPMTVILWDEPFFSARQVAPDPIGPEEWQNAFENLLRGRIVCACTCAKTTNFAIFRKFSIWLWRATKSGNRN